MNNDYSKFIVPKESVCETAKLYLSDMVAVMQHWKDKEKNGELTPKEFQWRIGKLYEAFFGNEIKSGKGIHLYFSRPEFVEWLKQCGPVLDIGLVDILEEKAGKDKLLIFHFPSSFKFGSFAVGFRDMHPKKMFQLIWSADIDRDPMALFQDRDNGTGLHDVVCKAVEDINKFDPLRTGAALKIAMSTAMYIDAFPNMLRTGLPDDLRHKGQHSSPCVYTIMEEPRIKQSFGGTHATPQAHYRIGHFRILRSSKFVHKRFQTIFVHGTFVAGKAKTVLAPEDEESSEKYVHPI